MTIEKVSQCSMSGDSSLDEILNRNAMYNPPLFITLCFLEESTVWFFSGECQIESYDLCLCLFF